MAILKRHISHKDAIRMEIDQSSGLVTLTGSIEGTCTLDDPKNDTAERIRQDAALLSGYTVHPDNQAMQLVGVDVNRNESMILATFRFDYKWTSVVDVAGSSGVPPGWRLEGSTSESIEQVDRDINGVPMVTVTREPIQVADDIYDLEYTFATEQIPFNPQLMEVYAGARNADPFFGRQPGQCKISRIYFQWGAKVRDVQTINAQAVMQVRVRGPAGVPPIDYWAKRVLAEGYYIFKDGKRQRALELDEDGNEITGEYSALPVLHNIQTGERITNPLQAQFYTVHTKPLRNFGIFFQSMLTRGN